MTEEAEPRDDPDSPAPDVNAPHEHVPDLDLNRFESVADEHGLSLDELSQTFADMIHGGQDPYAPPATTEADDHPVDDDVSSDEPAVLSFTGRETAQHRDDDDCEITPKSILESMLFVGHPDNEPLSCNQVASMMRGVSPAEIHDLVAELNEDYDALGSPFEIRAIGAGYAMTIRDRYASLRDRFHGKIRDARLSQAAIDVLAIVAYNQPLTREEVERMRGRPSGSLLRQLVRRELLRIQRTDQRPRKTTYYTTDRFLELFGMEQVEDLPQSQELE